MTDTDTTDRTVDRRGRERLASDGVHPLRVQLRHRDPPRRRRPTRSSASAATRPTRRRRATRARRRCGSTTTRTVAASGCCSPLRRRADGTFEEIDWDTAIREVADRLAAVRDAHGGEIDRVLRRRRPGQPPRRRLRIGDAQGVRRPVPRQRHRPGEDRRGARQWARCSARRCAATSSTARSRSSSARTRGSRHGIPHARTTLKAIAADPGRAMIVIDPRVTETAASWPTSTSRSGPGRDAWLHRRDGRRARRRGPASIAPGSADHASGVDVGRSPRSRDVPISRYCEISGVDEDAGARGDAADRGRRRASRCSRTSACR